MFIYQENFFYDYILNKSVQDVERVLENKEDSYYTIEIPKKNGMRILNCINRASPLYEVQSSLKKNFMNHIPISEPVYGFVKEQSYNSYLIPHLWDGNNKRYYLRMDIKDYFGSIKKEIIEDVFRYYFKVDETSKEKMVKILTDIVCLNGALPQGGVTSPSVSNIVFRQLDQRIQKYCKKYNVTYSRYADDLLFSSSKANIHEKFFSKKIGRILSSRKFKVNTDKTICTESEISLNGFVVGRNIRLSRNKLRDIKRVLFLYEHYRPDNIKDFLEVLNSNNFQNRIVGEGDPFVNKRSLINYLNGYRSFLISWIPSTRKSKDGDVRLIDLVKRIEKLVTRITKMN